MAAGDILKAIKKKRLHEARLEIIVHQWLESNPIGFDEYTQDDFDFIEKLIVRDRGRDISVFSPSGATKCMRHQVIAKDPELPQNRTFDSRTQMIFDDGNWRHIKWQVAFYKMGIVDSVETFRKMGHLRFGGSTDVVIKPGILQMSDGYSGRVIVDIKGANSFAFKSVLEKMRAPLEYEIQVQVYMMIHGIKWAIVWFENKDTQDIVEIEIKADPKLQKFMRKRLNYMRGFVRENIFPKEECNVEDGDRTFRKCPSRDVCPRLPVHVLRNGEATKIHSPRIKDPDFQQYDDLPLKRLKGKLGERRQSSRLLIG